MSWLSIVERPTNKSSFQVAIQLLYSKTIIDILDEAEEDMDTDENPAEDDEDDDSTKDDDDNVMYRNNIYVSGFSVVIICNINFCWHWSLLCKQYIIITMSTLSPYGRHCFIFTNQLAECVVACIYE